MMWLQKVLFPFYSRLLVNCMMGILLIPVSLVAADLPEVKIPSPSDWTNRGMVLEPSSSGWDRYFGDRAPATVVKKNGTYFLYYVGSSGPRSDGKPRDRALGVATSSNGINFTKYSGNPVLQHQPHNNDEEGIISAAATLDSNGNIVLYYGALWAQNSTTNAVDVYIKKAISSDGLHFTDNGTVFQEDGNENWPFSVINAQGGTSGGATGNWHIWYGRKVPKYLLMGNSSSSVNKVGRVLPNISASWFMMEAVQIGGGKIAAFMDNPMEAWVSNINTLDQYQGPIKTYNLASNRRHGSAIMLDRGTNTWYLYFRTSPELNHITEGHEVRLWTAPAKFVSGSGEVNIPSAPGNLSAQ